MTSAPRRTASRATARPLLRAARPSPARFLCTHVRRNDHDLGPAPHGLASNGPAHLPRRAVPHEAHLVYRLLRPPPPPPPPRTPAPRRTASRATARPIFPDERFPTKRTLSIGSCVPPAVVSTRSPERGPPKAFRTAFEISPGEAISFPEPSNRRHPSLRKSSAFSRT